MLEQLLTFIVLANVLTTVKRGVAGKTLGRVFQHPTCASEVTEAMSTTETTQKTLADDVQPTEEFDDDQFTLRAIAAETTSNVETLPNWDVYNAACDAVLTTLQHTTTEGF